jgi:hypothetical protein
MEIVLHALIMEDVKGRIIASEIKRQGYDRREK